MIKFEIEPVTLLANEKQLEYLRSKISEKNLIGIGRFIQEQEEVFERHCMDLEAVFAAFADAPNELKLKPIEEAMIQYLKEQGVSATRISMIKGSIRLKKLIKTSPHFYRPEDREILASLKSEKAYLASRMTFEGQRKTCNLARERGNVTIKEMRLILKDYEYDPSSNWKIAPRENDKLNSPRKYDKTLNVPKGTIPPQIAQLVSNLGLIIDELVDQYELWEKDSRVHEMIDRDSLVKITTAMCEGWYVDPSLPGSGKHCRGYYHPSGPEEENDPFSF